MHLRKAIPADHNQIGTLYYNTVTTINKRDYTPEQIRVWAGNPLDTEDWTKQINEQHFFVAEELDKIIGFGSVTDEGYLDYMYVHKDFQGQGVATALLNAIEEVADNLKMNKIWARVSITARPFFASKGFTITKQYSTIYKDVEFPDCIMTKFKSPYSNKSNNVFLNE